MKKEFLYVGYYIDEDGQTILKVGTTNNLKVRQAQHTRNYRTAKHHPMEKDGRFTYLWSIPLSKYNTHRYEDKTKERWIEAEVGEYIRNDRFVCREGLEKVTVTIRNTYEIYL